MDPFFEHTPKHFGMTFKELLAAKHPTTWLTFEEGNCSEAEAMAHFFADGREVDLPALQDMMVRLCPSGRLTVALIGRGDG